MKIGTGVVINLGAKVKYVWRLNIGEHAWIDNLTKKTIGTNSCVSQRAYLCTGSHDWSDRALGHVTRPMMMERECWVGAKACLAPGTFMEKGAVLAMGVVGRGRLEGWQVNMGAAIPSKARIIRMPRFDEQLTAGSKA